MSKITKQEFENYNKQFLSIFARVMDTSEFKNESKEEQEKYKKFFGLLLGRIQLGNILALYSSCEMAKDVLNEDVSTIKRRVKEHIIARGYYNPAAPLTLAEFRERRKKLGYKNFRELWENKEQSYKLLSEMDREDRDFIIGNFNFVAGMNEIFPKEKDEKMTEEDWQSAGFIWEDVLKTFEAAQKKLEQAERERERERETTPVIPAVPLSLTPRSGIMIR
ncbi:MAG: hypothetical protein MRERV_35c041 [Mycoplasmataceae bacterium RV_VA103A]|nr:MAG: hypothetical protein MRERV_35c041 [Mycoplasmataceae bacterium RV_VA103A]